MRLYRRLSGTVATEMSPEFIAGLRRVAEEPSLFRDDAAARLEALRPLAGSGIGAGGSRQCSRPGGRRHRGLVAAPRIVKAAVQDRAHNAALRQIEEHVSAQKRQRRARTTCGARLAERRGRCRFRCARRARPQRETGRGPRAPAKQTGLDDGVNLP